MVSDHERTSPPQPPPTTTRMATTAETTTTMTLTSSGSGQLITNQEGIAVSGYPWPLAKDVACC